MKKLETSIDDLRRCFIYDKATGKIYNRIKRSVNVNAGDEAGCMNGEGYLVVKFRGSTFSLHRLAYAMYYGEWPEQIDHVNGDRADNRINNLRSATLQENNKNKKLPRSNTSGHMGVSWSQKAMRWTAYISVKGKNKNLGSFNDIADAIVARKTAEIENGYHENHGRGS